MKKSKSKKSYLSFFILIIVLPLVSSCIWKPQVVSGDLSDLVNIKKINIKFDYSDWTFYDENMTEDAYVKKRMTEITDDKGKEEAEKWHKDWVVTRDKVIPGNFMRAFNKLAGGDVRLGKNMDTPYTLVVHVEWTYPGYFAVVVNKPAKTTTTLSVIKDGDNENPLAVFHYEQIEASGKGMSVMGGFKNVNTNNRIGQGFQTTGLYFGKYVHKGLKKARKAS